MKKQLFLLLMSISLVLVVGCASEDDDSVVSTQTTATVVVIFPPDATTDVLLDTSIYVTFNQAVEPTSMTANTAGINFYGDIQLSEDDFSTCLEFVTSPNPSNNNTCCSSKYHRNKK